MVRNSSPDETKATRNMLIIDGNSEAIDALYAVTNVLEHLEA